MNIRILCRMHTNFKMSSGIASHSQAWISSGVMLQSRFLLRYLKKIFTECDFLLGRKGLNSATWISQIYCVASQSTCFINFTLIKMMEYFSMLTVVRAQTDEVLSLSQLCTCFELMLLEVCWLQDAVAIINGLIPYILRICMWNARDASIQTDFSVTA